MSGNESSMLLLLVLPVELRRDLNGEKNIFFKYKINSILLYTKIKYKTNH